MPGGPDLPFMEGIMSRSDREQTTEKLRKLSATIGGRRKSRRSRRSRRRSRTRRY